ncbi:hypothetical protein V6N11_077121 [Hibiscus sabdariffa]|uniref:Uncharacterized protein n=1 Tax=Hibiscus sabdariffa TaxID=183260 RepID=A0ABR2TC51_9ROSI
MAPSSDNPPAAAGVSLDGGSISVGSVRDDSSEQSSCTEPRQGVRSRAVPVLPDGNVPQTRSTSTSVSTSSHSQASSTVNVTPAGDEPVGVAPVVDEPVLDSGAASSTPSVTIPSLDSASSYNEFNDHVMVQDHRSSLDDSNSSAIFAESEEQTTNAPVSHPPGSPAPALSNKHAMITRSKAGTFSG